MTKQQITELTQAVTANFRTFGGGATPSQDNPLTHWLKDEAAVFALGVPVDEVVKFVVAEARRIERRDIAKARAAIRKRKLARV